ncbi:BURP domain protein USPL1-like [Olea europaea var. sylvestris]|uniref:BURP domain protein USPL1-like n=1 Tax=Olea europaea var. sylvestris TaxID=158386 RepID=UPI000C1D401A|nr:BURP domain protein USPL1-like [Olea europaea var. sylvestris]
MGFGFGFLVHLFCSLLVLQLLEMTEVYGENIERVGYNNHLRIHAGRDENSGKNLHEYSMSHTNHLDPELNVFFYINELKVGKKMPIYFPIKDPSTSPPLLSKEESDSIPFSSEKLPYILQLFSFLKGSKQAKAMENTLQHCEFPPLKGETKFCATSLESMLDSTRSIFGFKVKFKVLTTTHLTKSITLLQNYTILEVPEEILARKIVACHTLPYPYTVFYCHSQESDNKLFKVSLVGEDGGRVEAAAICHMDTSHWDPEHVSFRVLKTRPGASPVCHFFPADNLIWIPVV